MARRKGKPPQVRHDPDFKVKVIKTSIEKNLTGTEAEDLFGIGKSTWWKWKRIYEAEGEEALRQSSRGRKRAKKVLHPAIQEKLRTQAAEVKRKYPFFGVQRVWHWLLRTSFLPVSFRQVRQTMAEANLIGKPVKKKRKPREPRGFERKVPNDLWATDITDFPLAGGQRVYVIAFIDDYSRYIVSWGVFASCVTELVLEVLRRGIALYKGPEDIMSDHGPQFWVRRGKTQFQKFLQREDIDHILAGSPETNGKIEAFWGSMKKEWVNETKHKGDLEEVRDRLAHWINFYNFQRPHEEINCAPAERYFQYEAAMKAEIQKRIRKNELELSLSKTPPSQVIGEHAFGADKVEIRKEGDQFIVRLGDQVLNQADLDRKKEITHETQEGTDGQPGRGGQGREGEGVAGPDGAVGREVDRGSVPGDGVQADPLLQARGADGAGDGGDRRDAGPARPAEGSSGGGDEPGPGDGAAPSGASAAAKSDADLEEAPAKGSPPGAETRSGEAERIDGASRGRDGAGPAAGPSTPAPSDPGLEGQENQ
jgi:transposase InsO family protein